MSERAERHPDVERGTEAHGPRELSSSDWRQIGKRVIGSIGEDRLPVVSAGLAFYAMLSVFPALIALVSVYGLVSDPGEVERQISRIADALPSGAASLIREQLQSIVSTSSSTLSWTAVAAIAGALWTASGGAAQLIKSVNLAYDEEETRGFFRLRGVAILFTLGFIVFASLSLGLIIVVPPLLESVQVATGVGWLVSVGRFVLLAVALVFALGLIYRYAPDRTTPRWPWVSVGSIVATLIWIAGSILFSIYVSNFGSFGETYGSLAGVIVLLLWFYISGFIVLLGAEINSEIEHQTTVDSTVGKPKPMGRRGAVKADTLPEAP